MIPVIGRPERRGNSCSSCRGRGWKFRGFRRSVANAGDAGDRAMLRRVRIPCLACTPLPGQGSGDE
jgi:hypothetical protein